MKNLPGHFSLPAPAVGARRLRAPPCGPRPPLWLTSQRRSRMPWGMPTPFLRAEPEQRTHAPLPPTPGRPPTPGSREHGWSGASDGGWLHGGTRQSPGLTGGRGACCPLFGGPGQLSRLIWRKHGADPQQGWPSPSAQKIAPRCRSLVAAVLQS